MREENKNINKRSAESLGAENSSVGAEELPEAKEQAKGIIAAGILTAGLLAKSQQDKRKNNEATRASVKRMKCGKNVCWYYCKVCRAYSLCQNCYDKKSREEDDKTKEKGGDTVAVKERWED